jgi:cytochrome bd-type quinol oxidase subunit 1
LWRKSVEKYPLKTYMVKWAFWKIFKKNNQIATKRVLKSPHFEKKKRGVEIPDLYVLVGTRDLRTLWSPPVSLNQERHTQRRKAVNFIYFLWRKSVEKCPLKTYMVKWAFWKIFRKKKLKSSQKEFWNRHILRRKKSGVEISDLYILMVPVTFGHFEVSRFL